MKRLIFIIGMMILTIFALTGCNTKTEKRSEEAAISGGMSTVQKESYQRITMIFMRIIKERKKDR